MMGPQQVTDTFTQIHNMVEHQKETGQEEAPVKEVLLLAEFVVLALDSIATSLRRIADQGEK